MEQNPHRMLNRAELTLSAAGHRKEPEQKPVQAQAVMLETMYQRVKSTVHSGKTCQRASSSMLIIPDCPKPMMAELN